MHYPGIMVIMAERSDGASGAPPLTSVNRALDVLEALSDEPDLGLADLAARLEMAKPTVRRLLINLIDRGYVAQDPGSRRYRLGLRCLQLRVDAVRSRDVSSHARDQIQRIAAETGEQTALWVYDDGAAVCVDRVESRRQLRSHISLGSREPAWLLAAGRCLLSGRPIAEVDRLLHDEATELGDHDVARLKDRLERVAAQGYDVSIGDRWPEISAAAAIVRDHHGDVVAAIGLSGPTSRLPTDRLESLAQDLTEAVQVGPEAIDDQPVLDGS